MRKQYHNWAWTQIGIFLIACASGGCHHHLQRDTLTPLPPVDAPRELAKVALPDYVIEPPDVLLIDAISVVPRGPHRIAPLDVLTVQVTPTFPGRPIDGPFVVTPEGNIDLGPAYGVVAVNTLTVQDAAEAVRQHLARIIENPVVSVSLLQSGAWQQVAGEHLVGPDGTVNLGTYGRVFVTGLTIEQARDRIEGHLGQFLQSPRVALNVASYNSKSYYIITEGAGFGDGVARFPVTGNETVLDAISNINGLSQVSSKRIWIARPAPGPGACDQILPVDWVAITKGGSTTTNYQVLPGDRIFVAEDHWISKDTAIAKVLSPFERIFGFTLLGTQTIQQAKFRNTFGATGIFVP